jgi:cytochrome P450
VADTHTPEGTYRGVPEYVFDNIAGGVVMSHQTRWDELAAKHTGVHNGVGQGYWVVTEAEAVQAALQDYRTFSSTSVTALEPNPQYLWIPEMLDPPLHTTWRRLLGREFSPNAVAAREDAIRAVCVELIEKIAPLGEVDVLETFTRRFPTRIFMRLMGLPEEDLPLFLTWIHDLLRLTYEEDPNHARMVEAMQKVGEYFTDLIVDRRANPRDDLLSRAMQWEIDGERISDSDLHAFCVLMFQAGLDTVPTQLGWSFYHLASDHELRRAIVADPALIPRTVEELLRVYSFVLPSRKAAKDVEFSGCPIRKGEMVMLPLPVANRDPKRYPNPLKVDVQRPPTSHIAFGSGPHRCLGSHLARLELTVALQEWHERIPEYRLSDGQDLRQHGGMYGLRDLRLTW